MAEYEERSLDDLTEEPSQHRIDELRSKGQVAQSRDLTGSIALLGVMGMLYFISAKFVSNYSELLKEIFTKDLVSQVDAENWRSFIEVSAKCGRLLVMTVLPIGLASMVLGVVTSIAQVGFLISTEALSPDFQRVNPISGFGRIFSLKSLVEGFKTLLKFVVVVGAVYAVLKSELFIVPGIVGLGTKQILSYFGTTTARVFGVVGMMLLAVSGFDYWIQWRRFRLQAMMTKQEAKQDMKEREGDPQVRARIRAIQREAARKRMMKAIPKADVIVTNPTHIAVAIQYDPSSGYAPKVVAKGADFLAERIKKIGREHGVPTVENKPLARTLYRYVKVGQMIPRSLYQAVAEILAYVYKIKGKSLRNGEGNGPRTSP
ncbi:MAG: flagellar biosynthesis protein FlhB [Bdellovibrionota bacterium]